MSLFVYEESLGWTFERMALIHGLSLSFVSHHFLSHSLSYSLSHFLSSLFVFCDVKFSFRTWWEFQYWEHWLDQPSSLSIWEVCPRLSWLPRPQGSLQVCSHNIHQLKNHYPATSRTTIMPDGNMKLTDYNPE